MRSKTLVAFVAIAGMALSVMADAGLPQAAIPAARAQSEAFPDLEQELPSDVTMDYLGSGIVPSLPETPGSLRLERVVVAPGESRPIVSADANEILYIESGELLFTDELGIEGPYAAGTSLFVYPGFIFGYRNGAEGPASLLRVTLPGPEEPAAGAAAPAGTPAADESGETLIVDVPMTEWDSADAAFLFLAEMSWEPGADLRAHVFTGPVGLLVTAGVLNVSGPSGLEGPRTTENPALPFPAWALNRERNVSDEEAKALIVGIAPVGARWYRSVSSAPAVALGTPGVVPMFRANEARTGVMPGPAPEGDSSLLWIYEADESVRSAPAVSGGTVYFGDDAGVVHAVVSATGVERWELPTNGPVRSGPAVVGETVYVGSEDGVLYAIDTAPGAVAWQLETGPGGAASPAIVLGTVYVGGADGFVYAADANTGNVRWTYELGSPVVGNPAVVENTVYVGAEDGSVVAIDRTNGEERWIFKAVGEVRGPVATGEKLLIATTSGMVQAIDLEGKESWRYDVDDDGDDSEVIHGAPAVFGDAVYVATSAGDVHSIDIESGQPRWQVPLGAPIRSSPAIVDGLLYVGTDDGSIHALDALTGELRWTPFQTGGPVLSSPAVVDGLVFVGSDDARLYAIGGNEGERAVTPTPLPATAQAIAQIVVVEEAELLAAPARSAFLRKQLPAGTRVRLLESIVGADGATWWRVEETEVSNPQRGYILESTFVVVEG